MLNLSQTVKGLKRMSKMHDLSKSLKSFLKERGTDLVGIASIRRFAEAPEGHHPQDFMSDATAVVSIGVHWSYGIIDALRKRKTVNSHRCFSTVLSDRLNRLAYLASNFFETQEFKAYPIPSFSPYDPIQLEGDISHKHAAVAAGLGEIGWNNLFISPQYGPRQELSSIITNAPLKADSLLEKKLCAPEKCGYKCAVCPTGAISKTEKESFRIQNNIYEHGKHSEWRCYWGCGSINSVLPLPTEEVTIKDIVIGPIAKKLEKSKERGHLDETTVRNLFYSRINKGEVPWCWLACLTHCPLGNCHHQSLIGKENN